MSFAAPIFLGFLGLAAPIILLYLLRQRRRRIEVSTLMFWDQILRDEHSVTNLTKLRKLLSLLLQLAFLALLVFALARPVLSGKLTGARRVVLLLDTSASMLVQSGHHTRFDEVRDQALGVVRGLSLGDTCMAVSVATEVEILRPFTDSKKELQETIEALAPTHGESNFRKALELVEQLPPDARETQVYLVTDGSFDPFEAAVQPKTGFAFLRVGVKADNVGITAFQVRPLPSSPRDFQVHLELTNDSPQEQRVPVELRINGRLTDAFEFTLPAGQSLTRTLQQFSAHGGEIEVVAIFPDAFPLDNRAFAVLPPPRAIKVRLVTPGNIFLERALATDDDVALEVVKPEQYVTGVDAAVTIFAGWKPVGTPPGNSIFIGDWPDDVGLKPRGELAKPIFTEWQREHPVNRHLSLQNVSIERAQAVDPDPSWQKLAASFGDPLVLLREEPTRKVLVVTFDTQTTDLPLRIAFPIMVANAVKYLGNVDTAERWVNPPMGSIQTRDELGRYGPGMGATNAALVALLGPEGKRIILTDASLLVPVDRAGVYWGEFKDGTTNALFAANLASARESRIQPADKLPLTSKQPLEEIKTGFRLGFEPWVVLVTLAAMLSVSEWVLFHRRIIE